MLHPFLSRPKDNLKCIIAAADTVSAPVSLEPCLVYDYPSDDSELNCG